MARRDLDQVFQRLIPEDQRLVMRDALMNSYKPRQVQGAQCGFCGALERPVSLHLADFYAEPTTVPQHPAKFLGANSIGKRWSIPACTKCAPPCNKCGLPISTHWTRAAIAEFRKITWAKKLQQGLGVCRHTHLARELASRFTKPFSAAYWVRGDGPTASMEADMTNLPDRSRGRISADGQQLPPGNNQASAQARRSREAEGGSPSKEADINEVVGALLEAMQEEKKRESDAARAALKRQFGGWDIGEFGGLRAVTRYADQPTGYRVRYSLIPVRDRIDFFIAIIPPPDALNCDRQTAIRSVRKVIFGVGSQEISAHQISIELLGQHGVQITGWFISSELIRTLAETRSREEFMLIGILTIEPYTSQLGGSPLVVPSGGLKEALDNLAILAR